jgi:hypothetical protein
MFLLLLQNEFATFLFPRNEFANFLSCEMIPSVCLNFSDQISSAEPFKKKARYESSDADEKKQTSNFVSLLEEMKERNEREFTETDIIAWRLSNYKANKSTRS